MAGNVWEWCEEMHYENDYQSLTDSIIKVPHMENKNPLFAARGGSFRTDNFRCAYRGKFNSNYRDNHVGFRIVLLP